MLSLERLKNGAKEPDSLLQRSSPPVIQLCTDDPSHLCPSKLCVCVCMCIYACRHVHIHMHACTQAYMLVVT